MLRKVLIWIVVTLLPLQGYAAAAMISCGPMHARMSLGAAESAPEAAEHLHATHSHAAHGQAAHSHGEPASDNSSDLPAFGDLARSNCSACASCCTAPAAPTPSQLLMGLPRSHAEAIPFFPTSEDSVVPDGLERPPRHHLA